MKLMKQIMIFFIKIIIEGYYNISTKIVILSYLLPRNLINHACCIEYAIHKRLSIRCFNKLSLISFRKKDNQTSSCFDGAIKFPDRYNYMHLLWDLMP